MKIKNIVLFVLVIISFFTLAVTAQEAIDKKANKEARKQEREKIERILDTYKVENCTFSDINIKLLKIDRIAKDKNDQNLARETAKGVKGVSRTDGYRLIFVQENDKYLFANFRVDRSRPESYESDKKVVLETLEKAGNDTQDIETSKPVEKNYNGFPSYNINRKNISVGNTIGITNLFDDKNYIIMTIYFTNMPPNIKSDSKLFNNIQEWKTVTSEFLNSYTKCLNEN